MFAASGAKKKDIHNVWNKSILKFKFNADADTMGNDVQSY